MKAHCSFYAYHFFFFFPWHFGEEPMKAESRQDNFQPFQTSRIWQEFLTRAVMKPTKRCDLLLTGSGTLCWQVPVRLLKSMSCNVSFPPVSFHRVWVFQNEQRAHFEDLISRYSVPLSLQKVWFYGQTLTHKQPIQTQDFNGLPVWHQDTTSRKRSNHKNQWPSH